MNKAEDEKDLIERIDEDSKTWKAIKDICNQRANRYAQKLIKGRKGDIMDTERGMIFAFRSISELLEKESAVDTPEGTKY